MKFNILILCCARPPDATPAGRQPPRPSDLARPSMSLDGPDVDSLTRSGTLPFERPGGMALALPQAIVQNVDQDLDGDIDALGAYLHDVQLAVRRQPGELPEVAALMGLRMGLNGLAITGRDGGLAAPRGLQRMWQTHGERAESGLARRVLEALTCEVHLLCAHREVNCGHRPKVS